MLRGRAVKKQEDVRRGKPRRVGGVFERAGDARKWWRIGTHHDHKMKVRRSGKGGGGVNSRGQPRAAGGGREKTTRVDERFRGTIFKSFFGGPRTGKEVFKTMSRGQTPGAKIGPYWGHPDRPIVAERGRLKWKIALFVDVNSTLG